MKKVLRAAAACVLMSTIGCGSGNGRIKVYPVQGKVVVKGQPAANARVVFYALAPATEKKVPTPAADTDADGAYRLTTYEPDDGAPAGEYGVTVVWPETPPPNFHGIFEAKDRLAGRYASPEKSNIMARVETGGGDIAPFELQ